MLKNVLKTLAQFYFEKKYIKITMKTVNDSKFRDGVRCPTLVYLNFEK